MKKKGLRRIAGLLLAAVLLCGCSTLPGTASSSRDEPKVLTVGCDTYAPFRRQTHRRRHGAGDESVPPHGL